MRGLVLLPHSTDQSSSLLWVQQEMKLHLGLPHLWFLLGSPRAAPHHPDPRGLLPPLKVLWHLKNNTAFTQLLGHSPLEARVCLRSSAQSSTQQCSWARGQSKARATGTPRAAPASQPAPCTSEGVLSKIPPLKAA